MKQCLMFKLIACLVLISIPIIVLAAEPVPPPKTVDQPIDVQFSDTPLPAALDAMFKGTGKTCTLDPALQQFRITAVFKNVSFDTALTQVLSALGATYEVTKEGVYHIKSVPQQWMTQQAAPAPATAPPAVGAASDSVAKSQGAVQTTVSTLNYINAYDAANAIANARGVQQVSASGNKLIIQATPEGNSNAAQIIAGLDNDKSLPRPVRLKMSAKITIGTVRGPKTYEASTESVGAEQAPVLLNLDTQETYNYTNGPVRASKLQAPQIQRTSLVNATIVPSINPDGRIGLVGKGRFSFPLGSGPGAAVSKDFGIAASALAGKPYTVAAGSMNLPVGKVDFAVTVTATPEEGRVYMSPSQYNAQQNGSYGGGNPNASPPPSNGGARSW